MPMQCQIDTPVVKGLEDFVLTVGREFYLNCKGDWPKTLHQDKLSFAGEGNQKYLLKLLKFEFRNPQEADLKVTSYTAGTFKWPNLILQDGTQNVELGPVAIEVHTVLPKGEKVEPYGPMGPATIPVPLLYWLMFLAVIVIAISMVSMRFYRRFQRRKMLERLKEHDAAMAPLPQFHQSMRKLQRGNAVFYGQVANAEELRQGMAELFRMFKVYLSRRLRVPAFEWNEKLILKDIRQYHPLVYQDYGRKVGELYKEFKKAENPAQPLQSGDVVQLSETLRKTLEGVEQSLEHKSGGGL